MRLGKVIGRVTFSQSIPAFEGGRWLIVNPYTCDQFQSGDNPPESITAEPSLVVYDSLGGDVGSPPPGDVGHQLGLGDDGGNLLRCLLRKHDSGPALCHLIGNNC